MRKIIKFLFLFSLLCIIHIDKAYALDFSVFTNIDKNEKIVEKGEKISLIIGVKSDEKIASCIFNIKNDSSLKLEKQTAMNTWNLSSQGESGILVENSLDSQTPTNGEDVLSLTYTVNNNGKIKINSECSPLNGEELVTYKEIEVKFSIEDDLSNDIGNAQDNNPTHNPQTGSNLMGIVIFILITSLVGTIYYVKNNKIDN